MPPALYVPCAKNFPPQPSQADSVVSEPAHVHDPGLALERHQHVLGPAQAWHSGDASSLRWPAGHGPVGSWLGLALGLALGLPDGALDGAAVDAVAADGAVGLLVDSVSQVAPRQVRSPAQSRSTQQPCPVPHLAGQTPPQSGNQ